MSTGIDVLRRAYEAFKAGDAEALIALSDPEIEFGTSAAAPGGTYRGHQGAVAHAAGFLTAWNPYQGANEIKLDPHIWGDGAGTVSVLFRHRAVDPQRGVRLDAPEVSVYHVRDGKVVRSQMFHADSSAVAQFLTDAQSAAAAATEEPS